MHSVLSNRDLVGSIDSYITREMTMHISCQLDSVRVDAVIRDKNDDARATITELTIALRQVWPDTDGGGAFWQNNVLYGAIRIRFDGHYADPRRSAIAVAVRISKLLQLAGYTIQAQRPPSVAERMRHSDGRVIARRWGLVDCAHATRSLSHTAR